MFWFDAPVHQGEDASITLAAVAITTAIPNPSVSGGATVSPAAVAITTLIPAETVTVGTGVEITVSAVLISSAIPTLVVTAGTGASITVVAVPIATGIPTPSFVEVARTITFHLIAGIKAGTITASIKTGNTD